MKNIRCCDVCKTTKPKRWATKVRCNTCYNYVRYFKTYPIKDIHKECLSCNKPFHTTNIRKNTCTHKCASALWYKKNLDYSKKMGVIHYKNIRKVKENRKDKVLYKNNIDRKLAKKLRCRIAKFLKGNYKAGSAVSDLGCSIPELKQHLEALFQPNMNWKNWSLHGWHIDHIKPLASFDLSSKEEFLKACHYSNLQPLWAIDNLKKGASYE